MRIMGLDFGSRTVGVAISDPLLITAQGIEIIRRKEENKLRQTLARIEELIVEYEVEEIVLGLPKNMNATEGVRVELTNEFKEKLDFYSCTVASFEQYTLARFLSRGYFEKHINRMRKFYRTRRNRVVSLLETCAFSDKITILEQDAGLHFLVKVDTELSDAALTEHIAAAGIRIKPISSYYHLPAGEDRHLFVVNYSVLDEEVLSQALNRLLSLL